MWLKHHKKTTKTSTEEPKDKAETEAETKVKGGKHEKREKGGKKKKKFNSPDVTPFLLTTSSSKSSDNTDKHKNEGGKSESKSECQSENQSESKIESKIESKYGCSFLKDKEAGTYGAKPSSEVVGETIASSKVTQAAVAVGVGVGAVNSELYPDHVTKKKRKRDKAENKQSETVTVPALKDEVAEGEEKKSKKKKKSRGGKKKKLAAEQAELGNVASQSANKPVKL